jgi:hypothetical protein
LVIDAEIYGLVFGPKAGKRITSYLGSQFATLGANVPQFIRATLDEGPRSRDQ